MLILDSLATRALTNLSANPDFVSVLEWIDRTQSERVADLLRASNPVSVHQLQGYCSALGDFARIARSAPNASRLVSAER